MTLPNFQTAAIRHHANPDAAGRGPYPDSLSRHFNLAATAAAVAEISKWPGYRPTDLAPLAELAAAARLGAIYYKDESSRFGLGSFKALGGAYAVLGLLQQRVEKETGARVSAGALERGGGKSGERVIAKAMAKRITKIAAATTVVTATDGNHGRSVAWGAKRFGCRCRIYIHAGVSAQRAAAMGELGAEVIQISGNYDESVRLAAQEAAANGWYVVSDTSYAGYAEVPASVMAGYSVMLEEIMQQLSSESPKGLTHVFVQGGVGGLAASVAAYLWEKLGTARPRFIVVEPELADCLFQSARNRAPTEVAIIRETIMAGLSCGEVSQLAWEVLSVAADDFLTIADELVAPTMAMLAYRTPSIEAGESAVAGLIGCLVASAKPELKAKLELDEASRVLVLGTEGATDRKIYDAIVAG